MGVHSPQVDALEGGMQTCPSPATLPFDAGDPEWVADLLDTVRAGDLDAVVDQLDELLGLMRRAAKARTDARDRRSAVGSSRTSGASSTRRRVVSTTVTEAVSVSDLVAAVRRQQAPRLAPPVPVRAPRFAARASSALTPVPEPPRSRLPSPTHWTPSATPGRSWIWLRRRTPSPPRSARWTRGCPAGGRGAEGRPRCCAGVRTRRRPRSSRPTLSSTVSWSRSRAGSWSAGPRSQASAGPTLPWPTARCLRSWAPAAGPRS